MISPSAACSIPRSSSGWATSAARPSSTRPPAAIIGHSVTRSSSPAAGSEGARRLAHRTKPAPTPLTTPSPPPTSTPPFSDYWATTPARSRTTPPTVGPRLSPTGSQLRNCFRSRATKNPAGLFQPAGFRCTAEGGERLNPIQPLCLRIKGPSPLMRATLIAGCFEKLLEPNHQVTVVSKIAGRGAPRLEQPRPAVDYRRASERATTGCVDSAVTPIRNFFAATYWAGSSSLTWSLSFCCIDDDSCFTSA